MKKNPFAFYDFSEDRLPFKVVFIVGPCRSGKSTLGRLAGSLRDHFHIEEDWWLLMLPILCAKGRLDLPLFVNAVRAWVAEAVYDAALMRRASFRPSDHSFVRRMKSDAEVRRCLEGLRGRADVDAYFKRRDVTFIFNLAEINPFIDLLRAAYPKAPIVHVSRHPAVIAEEIHRKRWFDNANLVRPSNRQVYRRVRIDGRERCIPFWVEARDVRRFAAMTERQRACFYPWQMYRLSAAALAKVGSRGVRFVFYEDLLGDAASVLRAAFPGAIPGEQTASLLAEIASRPPDAPRRPFRAPHESLSVIDRHIPGFGRRYAS